MSFEKTVEAGRTVDLTLRLYEADGSTAVVLAETDHVRVKIGRAGSVPALDLDSVGATANGSVVTITNRASGICTVRLAQGDTLNLEGPYDCEALVVDDSETAPADAIKAAEKGVIHFTPSQLGDLGKT